MTTSAIAGHRRADRRHPATPPPGGGPEARLLAARERPRRRPPRRGLPVVLRRFFGHGDPRVRPRSERCPRAGHPFGYDLQGCDVFANVVYARGRRSRSRCSPPCSRASWHWSWGRSRGMVGGWVDAVLARLTDVFPRLPVPARRRRRPQQRRRALGADRLARARTVRLADHGAARPFHTCGASGTPSSCSPPGRWGSPPAHHDALRAAVLGLAAARLATITVGGVIVSESSLTYLGIGLESPAISWGLQSPPPPPSSSVPRTCSSRARRVPRDHRAVGDRARGHAARRAPTTRRATLTSDSSPPPLRKDTH